MTERCHLRLIQQAIAAYVQSFCACIDAAKDQQTVEGLLRQAVNLLLVGGAAQADASTPLQQITAETVGAPAGALSTSVSPDEQQRGEADDGVSDANALLSTRAAALQQATAGHPQPAVQAAFGAAQFQEFAGCLLSGANSSELRWYRGPSLTCNGTEHVGACTLHIML